MNRFTADYSSSLPSTPDVKSSSKQQSAPLSTFKDFSTTPAGPPPSSVASFTPSEPPPSNSFGSSQFGPHVSKLRFTKGPDDTARASFRSKEPTQLPPRTKNGTPARLSNYSRQNQFSAAKLASQVSNHSTNALQEEGYEDDGEFAESMNMGVADKGDSRTGTQPFVGLSSVNTESVARAPRSSLFQRSTQIVKKPKYTPRASQLPRKGNQSIIPSISRDIASRSEAAPLTETDDMILSTEDVLVQLGEALQTVDDIDISNTLLSTASTAVLRVWQSQRGQRPSQRIASGIGPGESASSLQKANYLSSLLLMLHHPPLTQPSQPSFGVGSRSLALSDPQPLTTPQILLDWLQKNHIAYDDLYNKVRSASPNCTSHELFWDAVLSLTLRGQLHEVGQLLAEADFKYAISAQHEGKKEPGYSGIQLQAAHSLINRARQVLDGCPGTRYGDWDVTGSEWDGYRNRVSAELAYVLEVSESMIDDDNGGFGSTSIPTQSKVPWTLQQNLRVMYSILSGSAVEIIAQSLDWLEASISLTVWWDGVSSDSIATWSVDVSRSQRPDEMATQEDLHLSRLSSAFLCVTDPADKQSFQINTMSILEVGLASVLQGNFEGALVSLRSFSLPIAAAVAEIGSLAGWAIAGGQPHSGLDQEDLMVLNYGLDPVAIKKDDVLLAYGEALFEKSELRANDGTSSAGWELAIAVVARLDDTDLSKSTIMHFIEQIELVDQRQTNRLVSLCTDLGYEEEAEKVSGRYADYLINNTTSSYGTALICYARSHDRAKIRVVIDLLVSYCLVQSAAYPSAADIDYNLKMLVESPKVGLTSLLSADPEAAEMLSFYLAGYACLRRFYNLRDQEIVDSAGRSTNLRPLARKRAAAKALVAVIGSAADSIYGGLYDPERQSAIQVDALMTLLGEATGLLAEENGDSRYFTSDQLYTILAAVEDLQTVNSRVYGATVECLQTALHNYRGKRPPSPQAMLKKSMSSGTNSNFSFSMMGSEMLAMSEESRGGKSIDSSTVLVGDEKVARGWDWRAAFKDIDTTGDDVSKRLRLGIAKALSLAELEEGDGIYE